MMILMLMRRPDLTGLLVAVILPLWACEYGYDIDVTVTAPVDVQQAFSPSRPGLVVDKSTVIGRLCTATSNPVAFKIQEAEFGGCSLDEGNIDLLYGDAFVFDPTGFQVTYRADGDSEAVICGDTAEVHGRGGYAVQIYDVFPPLTEKDKVATGSGKGTCANATYSMTIDLSLR